MARREKLRMLWKSMFRSANANLAARTCRALGVVVAVLAATSTHCTVSSHACTLADCSDGAIITLRTANGEWPAGTYTAELTVDGKPGTCTVSVPPPPVCAPYTVETLACTSVRGTCASASNLFDGFTGFGLTAEEKCVTIPSGVSCTLIPGQFHWSIGLGGTPAQVAVTVSRDGRPFVTETVALQYKAVRPNGPDCEPTCHRASWETTGVL
jgi:hypothetical protein